MQPSQSSIDKTAYLYIAITSLLWSGMEVACKYVAEQFNPLQLTFGRVFVGGMILLPFAIKSVRKKGIVLNCGAMGKFAALGLLGVAISMTINQLAIVYAPASVVSSRASGNPVFIALLSWLLIGEHFGRSKRLSLAFDLIGICLIIRPWDIHITVPGVIYSLLAPLTFSLYSVLSKRVCREYGGLTTTCFCFIFGALEMMTAALLTHVPAIAEFLTAAQLESFAYVPFFKGYTVGGIPALLYIAVGATGIGFCCYFMAIEKSTALHASLVFFFKPILAPVYAVILLGENISENVLAGIICMVIGAALFALPDLLKKPMTDGNVQKLDA